MRNLIFSLALLILICDSQGAIVLTEDFAYADGPVVGALESPWSAHSGNTAGNEALIVSQKLQVTSARAEDINAPLLGAPHRTNSGTVLYASFTVNFNALPTSGGTYFAHFNSSGFRGLVWASTSGAAAGSFRLGIGNTTSASASSGRLPDNLSLNQNYFVVTRYNLASGVSTIWLNPVLETDFSATASDAPLPINISAYSFRQDPADGTIQIDDLKVGNSFADVGSSNAVLAPVITAQPQSQTVFVGSTVTFTVGASGSAPLSFQWKLEGTDLSGANGATLSLTNVSSGNAGNYSVVVSNNAGLTNSDPATLMISGAPPAAVSVLNYNTHGNFVEDWSTNSLQVRAIGRQVSFLNPDIITFQEIPATNTHQMTNFVKAFLPGYFLATNSGTDGFGSNIYIRSVIASRYPITRSKSWLDGAQLEPYGYTNSNFTRDLFEAEIVVPGFSQPLHVFTTHLKAGTSSSDDAAKRAAEASAISNFFVTSFLTTNANHPYLLTGDLNEDIARPATGSQQPIQRLANAATGLRVTTPLNPFTSSELTFSIQAVNGPTRRYDYIFPGGLLFSNIVSSQVFRTDLLNPVPSGVETNDTKIASDHLPVLMAFANPYNQAFQITSLFVSNSLLTLNWQSSSGRLYRVESSMNLTNWTIASATLTATGTNSSFNTNTVSGPTFFRVYRLP